VEEMSNVFYNELRRKVYITPKSYLDSVNTYLKCLGTKQSEFKESIDRLSNGL
jgi:dynein heavy chain